MSDKTTRPFPNRTWPWRIEDDGDAEAEAERLKRPEHPSHMEGDKKVYDTPVRNQTTAKTVDTVGLVKVQLASGMSTIAAKHVRDLIREIEELRRIAYGEPIRGRR
jgi:hypothetical protein